MRTRYLLYLIIFIFLSTSVLAVVPEANISIQFTINNFTGGGDSNIKSNKWISTDGELYKTYGGSDDTWGLSNLKGSNFTNATFQVVLISKAISAGSKINADNIQVKIYYTVTPNVTLIAPTPSNNSIIGSTLRVNATTQLSSLDSCKFQNNRNGTWVNETMSLWGNNGNCTLTLKGLNNNTFDYNVVATKDGIVGVSETRNVSIRNLPSLIDLISPINNTLSTNLSWILNWSINNTQDDDIIVRGFISQNTTNNITKQIFYFDEGQLNNSYIYNFTAMMTIVNNSQQLWALYRFNNDSDEKENSTHVKDFSQYSKNGTSTTGTFAFRTGKFAKGFYHATTSAPSEVKLQSNDFANVSVNGMSINVWVNLTDNSSVRTITQRFNTVSNDRFFRLQSFSSRARWEIYPYGNLTGVCIAQVPVASAFQENQWYMVTATFNGTQTRVYLNGLLNATTNCNFDGINQALWQDDEQVTIGETPSDTSNFEGVIDEMGFWNKSLSAQEVSDLYNLKNDTYFWYMESDEYNATNSRVNSSLFQFTIGNLITDTCVYTSGNWNILCSDNCSYNSNINIVGNVSISGAGNITFLNGGKWNWTTLGNYVFINKSLGNGCYIYTYPGGGFNR